MSEIKETKSSGGKKGLIIAFVVLLLGVNGVQLFFNLKQKDEVATKEQVIKEKDSQLAVTYAKLDSVENELKLRYDEIAKLGGDTAQLGATIREIEKEKAELKNSSNIAWGKYNSIKNKITGYETLLKEKDEEMVKWKAQVDTLHHINSDLKTTIVAREDSIKSLNLTKEELAQKVAIASILKAENLVIDAISAKGKEKTGGEYKAKGIDKLKVKFNIAENKVAKQEGKEIVLRIVEPDGSAIFDLATGGGSFTADGKEIFYSSKQEILFDNRQQTVTFNYVKGSLYKPGKHTVQIYAEGHKIGEGSFVIK